MVVLFKDATVLLKKVAKHIFLTYTTNMYLKYPPIDSNIVYLTINEFEEYLTNV